VHSGSISYSASWIAANFSGFIYSQNILLNYHPTTQVQLYYYEDKCIIVFASVGKEKLLPWK